MSWLNSPSNIFSASGPTSATSDRYVPRPASVRQNRYARKTLFQGKRGAENESHSCRRYYLMFSYKVASVLLRQMRRMKIQYQVFILLAIGLVCLCLSRIFMGSAIEEQHLREAQSNVQLHALSNSKGGQVVYENTPACNNQRACRVGQLGFHLVSGFENKDKPSICLNNKQVLENQDSGRGLNMVVVDGKVKEVVITGHADTYLATPPSLVDFLNKIAHGDVLMVATADDAAHKLSKEVKDILTKDFNSQLINQLEYRSAWVFVGQKGVKSSTEIEMLNLIHGQWADKAELRGCLSLPMSSNDSSIEPQRDASTNCNLPPCGRDKFPVAVQSGVVSSSVRLTPTVCVDGKQVMGTTRIKDYEPGSRGLNCIIFDPVQMKVIKISRFDTYNSAVDDTLVYKFLESLEVGQIVIIAVHDEGSRKLSAKTKNFIRSLGSSKIDDFNFRDNWLFIGQRGIRGFTPYEKLSFREGSGWGPRLEIKECIPLNIEGMATVASIGNRKKEEFCKQYNDYPDLCSKENVNKTLRPPPLDDMSLTSNPAYHLPIIVVPGVDLQPLQKCLSSLVKVPGLKSGNVLVILNGNYPEPNDLVKLYDFAIEYIKPKADYEVFLYNAIKQALELYKDKQYLIILEDYLEVTPDFLRYFSQTLHMMARDPTILTVSAWNPNGFVNTSGDETLVYRTEDFPGFGWIIRRSLWMDKMADKQKDCCSRPTWRQWSLGDISGGASIIPDVSRVRRIERLGGFYAEKRFMTNYLVNRTSSSASPLSEPTEVYKVEVEEYEQEILRLVTHSVSLSPKLLTSCLKGGKLTLNLPPNEKKIYAVFYKQDTIDDHTLLRQLCKCFGLFVFEDSPLPNMYHGIIRFTHRGNHFILVGSESVYYDSRPESATVLSKSADTDDKG